MDKYLFAAALGALVPSLVLLHLSERGLDRVLPAACNRVLDADLFLAAETIYAHLACMGDLGRAIYLDFYRFDLVLFPLIYATALHGIITRVWPTHETPLQLLPILAAVADVIENSCMCFLLAAFPTRHAPLEAVVSVLTRAKWALVGISMVVAVAGLVTTVVRGITFAGQNKKRQ